MKSTKAEFDGKSRSKSLLCNGAAWTNNHMPPMRHEESRETTCGWEGYGLKMGELGGLLECDDKRWDSTAVNRQSGSSAAAGAVGPTGPGAC